MKIAINTRFLLRSKMEGFGWFTYETVKRMVMQHPEHEFLFFFDRAFDQRFIFAQNVTAYVLPPPARHPLLFKYWFNISVTKALKKYQADIFLSPDGYLSLKTNVPQIGVIHDLNFEHYPEDLPRHLSKYLRNYFPKFAWKADQIITVSDYSKRDIVETYGIASSKITVVYNGGNDAFVPLLSEEIISARDHFVGGSEYFVFVGALHPRKNVKRLFEAFDQFKYTSGSDIKLLIVGQKLWRDKELEKAYNIMVSREAVYFTGHLSLQELTKAVGGAKALVFPSYFEGFGIPLVEAMKANCPIICANRTSLPEVVGDAATLVDPFSVSDLAEALFEMDSNGILRNKLIEKGRKRATLFDWDFTAVKIWEVVEKTFQK